MLVLTEASGLLCDGGKRGKTLKRVTLTESERERANVDSGEGTGGAAAPPPPGTAPPPPCGGDAQTSPKPKRPNTDNEFRAQAT